MMLMPTNCWNVASMMPGPDDRAEQRARGGDVAEARAVVGREARADLADLALGLVGPEQAGKHLARRRRRGRG
jgi:hypothetical protein